MSRRLPRRDFLKAGAAASLGYWVAAGGTVAASKSPNEQVSIACIGVGGKGRTDSKDAHKYGSLVAICDIDEKHLAASGEKYPQAKQYRDYRELLDALGDKLDAVVVARRTTIMPQPVFGRCGWASTFIARSRSRTPWPKPAMRTTAREYGVVTQMGNQGTATDGFRSGVELLAAEPVGPIREVHVWTNRPFKYWKQAPDLIARPIEQPPVPAHVHWDLFLGPAPVRPYHSVYHPHDWRGWWDFGTGSLGDMACHTANLAFMGLKLGLPSRVSAISGEVNSETYPAWATISYEFPARGGLPPVNLTWYEGARDGERNLPSPELLYGETPPASGMVFVGEQGSIFTADDYGVEQILLPRDKFANYKRPAARLPRLGGNEERDDQHKREWVQAIQGGSPTLSNFDYASNLTEAMLLGNVAVRVGKAIDYDGRNGRVTNCPEAQAVIDSGHREGWGI